MNPKKQTNYNRGYYAEYKLVRFCESNGMFVIRTPGSKGPADVIALYYDVPEGVFFQVKRVKKIENVYKKNGQIKKWVLKTIQNLRDKKLPHWGSKVVAIYVDEISDYEMFDVKLYENN